ALTAGGEHTCGRTSSGAGYCWGFNGTGQLGDGTGTHRLAPTMVSGGQAFTTLTAGGEHTCGLTSAGAAYCWGVNNLGQLGLGGGPTPVIGGIVFRVP
ncbi:MAG: RCC1 repeat-containing protein, partial [Cytophagaceae bacterium]|nr:RCC1 repeat-containing protein [Gemmatimonadaceae bacterium]